MSKLNKICLLTVICSLIVSIYYIIVEANSLAPVQENFCRPLEQPNYQFFSSATLYEKSKEFLEKNKSTLNSIVFGSKTLLEEHGNLLNQSCKPISFYFLGRHAARFPKGEKIEKHTKNVSDLRAKLRELSLKLKNETNKELAQSERECLIERFDKFINSPSKITSKQDYLITEAGSLEEQNIALRFKQIYPDFFNVNTADVDVGVTSKIRTSQTEAQFMKLVDGYNYPTCEELPTNDLDRPDYNADLIWNNQCYKNLMKNEVEEFLQFHIRCKKSLKKSKAIGDKKLPKNPLVERAGSQESIQRILDKVSRKLLNIQIDSKMLESILKMCIHETALHGESSIWCSLFDNEDIKALEYISDVKSYLVDSYGPDSNVKQACPLVGNLVSALESASKQSDGEKRKSYFYFTHDHALKKVISYFGLFKDDESYSKETIDNFVNNGVIPENREYKMHKLAPFSGNFAFTLYRCEKGSSNEIEHKLITTLNERPIKIVGCNNETVCDVNSFIRTYMSSRTDCNMEKICPL